MKKRNRPRGSLLHLLPLFFAFALALPSFAASLSPRTLENDLRYYRRTAEQKNLSANDRHYILLRIKEKYGSTNINLAPLDAEIRRLQKGLPVTTSSAEPSSSRRASSPAAGSVTSIYVSETADDSRIVIAATEIRRYNYFLLRDPEPERPPHIVLDLFGAREAMAEKAKDIPLREGLFARVRTAQFEEEPENVVRVVAELRKEVPYRVVKEENQVFILAIKKPAAESAAAPASPAAAAAPVPAVPPVPAETLGNDGAATDYYRIEAGDVLGITVFPAEELSREVIVQMDGTLPFPLIGSVPAKGLTVKQLENGMRDNLRRYIAHPQVTVTPKQFSRRQVFVTGEVRSVGAYNYRENIRLMEFISSLGGFTDNANRRNVKIYRGKGTDKQIHTVDVEEIIKSGDFSKDFLLSPGDIVEVPPGRARVAILGDVRTPGYYDHRENLHLLELVSLSGGFTDTANIAKVSILRQGNEKKQAMVRVNLKKILSGETKDIPIRNGDTVYIPRGPLASANWFVNTILPWLSLVSLVLVIRGGI